MLATDLMVIVVREEKLRTLESQVHEWEGQLEQLSTREKEYIKIVSVTVN